MKSDFTTKSSTGRIYQGFTIGIRWGANKKWGVTDLELVPKIVFLDLPSILTRSLCTPSTNTKFSISMFLDDGIDFDEILYYFGRRDHLQEP